MNKEEAIEILSKIMNNNFYGGEVQMACKMAVEAFSTPSFPSNLDEAAKRIAYDVCKQLPNGEDKDGIVYYAILAAIAGAEWMAGQGETLEVEVKEDAGGYPYIPSIELYDYDKDEPLSKPGDKVVVQIRKK